MTSSDAGKDPAFDFDAFYRAEDPWKVGRASPTNKRRARVVKTLAPLFAGRTVLEMGCGEGQYSSIIAASAASLTGVDISANAISRAAARGIANARFQTGRMENFTGYGAFDVIVMLECLYYLDAVQQRRTLAAIKNSGSGTFIIAAPVVGENEHRKYYTRRELTELLVSQGFTMGEDHVMSLDWHGARFERLALSAFKLVYWAVGGRTMDRMWDALPERCVYQQLFVCRY